MPTALTKCFFLSFFSPKYFWFLPNLLEMLPRSIMLSFRSERGCQQNFHEFSPPYNWDSSSLVAPQALPCSIFSKKLWTSLDLLLFIFMSCTWSLATDGDFAAFDAVQIQNKKIAALKRLQLRKPERGGNTRKRWDNVGDVPGSIFSKLTVWLLSKLFFRASRERGFWRELWREIIGQYCW